MNKRIEYFISFGVGGICGTAIYLCGNYLRKKRDDEMEKDIGNILNPESGLIYQSNRDLIKKLAEIE